MRSIHTFLFLVLAFSWTASVCASGGGSLPTVSGVERKTPEQVATERYNAGLKKRDKADKYAHQAAEAESEKDRAKYEKKARKAYTSAAKNHRRATDKVPRFYQAWASLGYAERKLGNYEAALEAYNEALRLNPAYPQAIEYRGEAYLGLNRLEEAKRAFVRLSQLDDQLAAELIGAMANWLALREAEPAGLDRTTIDDFGKWVGERDQISRQRGAPNATGEW